MAANRPGRIDHEPQYIVLAALRILVGLFFIASGFPKLLDSGLFVADFSRWGLPEPALFVWAVGLLEVIGGGLLTLGVAVRYLALLLALAMLGAVLTAGRIDGGSHLVLPPLLGLFCLLFAVRGGGAWHLPAFALGAARSKQVGQTYGSSPHNVWSVKTDVEAVAKVELVGSCLSRGVRRSSYRLPTCFEAAGR